MVGLLHRSAGGVSMLSLQSSLIHWLFGRPARRFQLCSGGWPSQINMTPECLVCWRIFGKPGNVTEDRIPMVFYEIRYQTETRAHCNLGVPDLVLPTDLKYLVFSLHVESIQASFIGREYCPCLTGVQENG